MKTLDHEWRAPELAPMNRTVRILWCDLVITCGYRFDAGNNGVRWYDESTNSAHEEADVVGWTNLEGGQ